MTEANIINRNRAAQCIHSQAAVLAKSTGPILGSTYVCMRDDPHVPCYLAACDAIIGCKHWQPWEGPEAMHQGELTPPEARP